MNFNKIVLPDAKETLLLGGSIAVCAALSSLVSHIIEKYLVGKSKIDWYDIMDSCYGCMYIYIYIYKSKTYIRVSF